MKILELNLSEIQLIECCLHPENRESLFRMRFLIGVLGKALVDKTPLRLKLSDEDLWFLRDIIDPHEQVGNIVGIDLIKKIYQSLLGYGFLVEYPDKTAIYPPSIKEGEVNESPKEEVENYARSDTRCNNQNNHTQN